MKINKLSIGVLAMSALMLAGCGSMSKTGKGALYGTGGGGLLGAGIGALAGGGKGAAIGAAVGAGVGAGAGALIGRRMQKQQEELAQIPDTEVETVTDKNGLQAIKVTFNEGILFDTGKSNLSAASRASLDRFADSVIANPETDVAIYGHTDNTGSRAVNEKLSQERAQAVANFLMGQGVPAKRIDTVRGLAYDDPIADNSTAAGRAKNRRVEIYITAGADMIARAERGDLD